MKNLYIDFDGVILDTITYLYRDFKETCKNYNEEEIKKNVIPLALEHVGEFTMSAWSHIYRRKFIEEEKLRFISEREVGSEDYLFNLQAFLSAKTLCAIKDDFIINDSINCIKKNNSK